MDKSKRLVDLVTADDKAEELDSATPHSISRKLVLGEESRGIQTKAQERSFEEVIRELKSVRQEYKKLTEEDEHLLKIHKQIEQEILNATVSVRSDLIKLRVVNESVETLKNDVQLKWNELENWRKKLISASASFLEGSVVFSSKFNSSDYGREKRFQTALDSLKVVEMDIENLQKELQPFYENEKKLKAAIHDNKMLEATFSEHRDNELDNKRKLNEELKMCEDSLREWNQKENEFQEKCNEEIRAMNAKIQAKRQSVTFWESKVSETQKSIQHTARKRLRFECHDQKEDYFKGYPMEQDKSDEDIPTETKFHPSSIPLRSIFQAESGPVKLSLGYKIAENTAFKEDFNQNYSMCESSDASMSQSRSSFNASGKSFQFKKKISDSSGNN